MAASSIIDLAKTRIELATAQSPENLNRLFRHAMRAYGFSTYAVGFLPGCAVEGGTEGSSQQPFLLLDWPKAWLELYAREGFAADDIVIAEASRSAKPFTWSEVRARHPGASTHIFAAAAEFGWADGFVVPFRDPAALLGEQLGVASLAASQLAGFELKRRKEVAALAFTAFARARALKAAEGSAVQAHCNLRHRERDTLILVAEGYSDAEIGRMLGISRAGAHFHIENAKKALGAGTRAQAVAIALTKGLL